MINVRKIASRLLIAVLSFFGFAPTLLHAQEDRIVITATRHHTFASLVNERIVPLVDGVLMPFLYSIAFLVFIFGIVRFFFFGGEENREKGKQFALWGLIGLVLLFSLWGIVNLLLDTVFPS